MPGSPSTADGTGAVMQALARLQGRPPRPLLPARGPAPGGGFPLGGNGAVNTQSTAWAIQGILAAGGDPSSFRRGGSSAPDYLAAQQASDGHYRYSASSDQTPIWVTGEVLIAAAGDSLPDPRPPANPTHKPKTSTPPQEPPRTPDPGPRPWQSRGSPGREPASPAPAPRPGVADPSRTFCDPRAADARAPAGRPPPGGERGRVRHPRHGTARVGSRPGTDRIHRTAPAGEPGSTRPGAIAMGLLAGCLLFAAALGIRRWWMHWRYGW